MKKNTLKIIILAITMATMPVHAGFSLSTTRVVFPSNEHEYDLTVTAGDDDVVFQSWLEKDGDSSVDTPFSVIPSLGRIHSSQAQIIKIVYQGISMPKDRESLFWLNVQEIPRISASMAEGKSSGLSFTIRQRIKMFFRPDSVKTDPITMTERLDIVLGKDGKVLKIFNSSNNFITLIGFNRHKNINDKEVILDSIMIPPLSEIESSFSSPVPSDSIVYFSSIGDSGFSKNFSAVLTVGKKSNPKKV
ncbi:MAG: molecular chaperone [Hafnia sp.]|uniref:fimbrial biogenesis chaperone n=1 Tax=Hafnia sp. TaxID=1873498 RepID=UPI002FC93E77